MHLITTSNTELNSQTLESLTPDDLKLCLLEEPYNTYRKIKTYLTECQGRYINNRLLVNFCFLTVCPCVKVPDDFRMFLEGNSIKLLSSPPERSITIVSIGSGGCYQELIYLVKLSDKSYNTIKLILIDNKIIPPLGVIDNLCKELLTSSTVTCIHYKTIEAYTKSAQDDISLKPDLLLAIDLTDKQFRIGGIPFSEYAYNKLREMDMLKPDTVIAHSTSYGHVLTSRMTIEAICGLAKNGQILSQIEEKQKLTRQVQVPTSTNKQRKLIAFACTVTTALLVTILATKKAFSSPK